MGKQLPDYMTPTAFVQMAKLPLTPNGKVDRKALPAPTVNDFEAQTEYVAPRDATERKLVQLWEQVLGISPISVTAKFLRSWRAVDSRGPPVHEDPARIRKGTTSFYLVPLSDGGATGE